MGRSYSLDLRLRIVGHVRAGHFGVSESCAVKLLKRADRTGSVEPAHRGRPRGKGKLAPHQAFLIARVEAQPDITMPELARALQAECGVIASPASLSRVLCTAGFIPIRVKADSFRGFQTRASQTPWQRTEVRHAARDCT